jgi:hypothetical protein
MARERATSEAVRLDYPTPSLMVTDSLLLIIIPQSLGAIVDRQDLER